MCGGKMENIHAYNAKIFKALCDEKRLHILELLRDGEKCACVLTDITGIKQSALSYHMKILCDSGIVNGVQDGKWTHYAISEAGCKLAIQTLSDITTPNSKLTANDCYLSQLATPSV